MSLKETLRNEGAAVRRFERADGVELVADFGPSADGSVEIVDETAIIVVEGTQYDITLDGDAQAFITNGILTIEVDE